jgi:hypothetical protein
MYPTIGGGVFSVAHPKLYKQDNFQLSGIKGDTQMAR